MLIKNKGLHRIAILISIICSFLIPDFLEIAYLFFNYDQSLWTLVFISFGDDYFITFLAFVIAFICFVLAYFIIKSIEWIYEGFKNN